MPSTRGFERMRAGYVGLLTALLARRFVIPIGGGPGPGAGRRRCIFFVGRDFFPLIDGGQIQLHVRAPAGTRIEATERIFQAVEDKIREVIPEQDRQLIVDNIGLPARSYNLAFTDGSTIGVNDGVILVALKEGHAPTADYVRKLREVLPAAFPETVFYFQAADIVTQILNFGLPAQIDVRTVGYDRATNLRVAKELRQRIAAIPGIVDAHLQQEIDAPAFYATIDRTRAAQLGLNAVTVANNLNVTLSSSEQVTPNFWTDPSSGIPYYSRCRHPSATCLAERSRQHAGLDRAVGRRRAGARPAQQRGDRASAAACRPTPTRRTSSRSTRSMPACRTATWEASPGRSTRSWPISEGAEARQHHPGDRPDREHEQLLPQSRHRPAVRRRVRLLLMVVNYQNFGDPLVVLLALPATFCGIVTMLFVTGTTLNVPSLMGAIMAVGVASANSILLVTFAREQQLAGKTAFEAAIDAGRTRIRPVLMTAAAMIVGMIPMAIGGAGEEQNAALARAVIGGLLFATPTTLLVVPWLFAKLRSGNDGKAAHGVFEEELA